MGALDFSAIPVLDNHCHPVLLRQHIDVLQFRGFFSEATHPSFAQKHLPHTVYYLWILRQLAAFHGCEAVEEAVVEARNSLEADVLLQRLLHGANIEALILDTGYPPPAQCYRPAQIAEVGGCRVEKMLRLEIVMQQLVMQYAEFDEVVARFIEIVSHAREQGYCALKSIVAYRTGLDIREWSKDEAVASFREARWEAEQQGQLRIAHKPLLDYLLHIAFTQAARLHMPIQFHTGYGDSDTDMRLGNPLHLRPVLERREYWEMPVVLLHESYPYVQLGAYLAAVYPHVYFDLSYAIPFLDLLEMQNFTRQALSVAPASKLMYSSDGIHVPELHWAAALRGRRVLAQVLQEMIDADEIDEVQAYQLAWQILRHTARDVYRL